MIADQNTRFGFGRTAVRRSFLVCRIASNVIDAAARESLFLALNVIAAVPKFGSDWVESGSG
jgi:hypothetical protein